jgi:hypothetical protein
MRQIREERHRRERKPTCAAGRRRQRGATTFWSVADLLDEGEVKRFAILKHTGRSALSKTTRGRHLTIGYNTTKEEVDASCR